MPQAGLLFDRMAAAFRAAGWEAPETEAAAMIAELRGCNRLLARLEREVELEPMLYGRGLAADRKSVV